MDSLAATTCHTCQNAVPALVGMKKKRCFVCDFRGMEDEDASYRGICVKNCEEMKNKFMDFHKRSLANIQLVKDRNNF